MGTHGPKQPPTFRPCRSSQALFRWTNSAERDTKRSFLRRPNGDPNGDRAVNCSAVPAVPNSEVGTAVAVGLLVWNSD